MDTQSIVAREQPLSPLPILAYTPVAPRWDPDAPLPRHYSDARRRLPPSHRAVTGHTARTVAMIVHRLGVASLDTVVRLGALLDDRGWRYYYTAVDRLIAAGILTRDPISVLGLISDETAMKRPIRRATTLRAVLTPGRAWAEWMDALVVGPAPLGHTPRRLAIAEQLVLGADVVRSVIDGWDFVEGPEWLNRSLALDNGRAVGHRADRMVRIQREGGLRFSVGTRAAGLIPCAPSGFARFLVGGIWSPVSDTPTNFQAVARVAPVNIVCWRRSAAFVSRIRSMARRCHNGQGYGAVMVLPSPSRGEWAEFWDHVADAVRLTGDAKVRSRLRTFFGVA